MDNNLILIATLSFIIAILLVSIFHSLWLSQVLKTNGKEREKNRESVEQIVTQTHRKMDHIEQNLEKFNDDIFQIKYSIQLHLKNLDSVYFYKDPISLTKIGRETSFKLNLDHLVANNWEKIHRQLKAHIFSNTPYDIQEYCIETATLRLNKLLSPEEIKKLKLIAYNNGENMYSYSLIIAILIRDNYLKTENISTSEIS